jgi:hypothetical protein
VKFTFYFKQTRDIELQLHLEYSTRGIRETFQTHSVGSALCCCQNKDTTTKREGGRERERERKREIHRLLSLMI